MVQNPVYSRLLLLSSPPLSLSLLLSRSLSSYHKVAVDALPHQTRLAKLRVRSDRFLERREPLPVGAVPFVGHRFTEGEAFDGTGAHLQMCVCRGVCVVVCV